MKEVQKQKEIQKKHVACQFRSKQKPKLISCDGFLKSKNEIKLDMTTELFR